MAGTSGNRSTLHQFLGVLKAVFPMETTVFSRARLDAMIDLRHPLAVLATRMPWFQIESNLALVFGHRDRAGRVLEGSDLYGPTMTVASAGISPAGRPRLPIPLMVALHRGVDHLVPAQIIHRGRFKTLSAQQRNWLKRKQAVEPVIGHLKADHRMDRCWLKGSEGDALHTVLCAAGFHLRWWLRAVTRHGLKTV
jgi:IS5 family transposase